MQWSLTAAADGRRSAVAMSQSFEPASEVLALQTCTLQSLTEVLTRVLPVQSNTPGRYTDAPSILQKHCEQKAMQNMGVPPMRSNGV